MFVKFLKDNLVWIGMVLLVSGLILILFSCSGDDRSAQVQQTTRSTEAVASAAADAVSTLEDRTTAERSIDEAVATATQEIQDAQSAQQVHSAVTSALCGKRMYRDDPACRVR